MHARVCLANMHLPSRWSSITNCFQQLLCFPCCKEPALPAPRRPEPAVSGIARPGYIDVPPGTAVSPCGNVLKCATRMLIPRENLAPGRVIIVGDIHGCCDEFVELLEKCEYESGKDTLLLVGDLVNKGPKSVEVVEKAMQLSAIAVRGNHDDAALHACRAGKTTGKYWWVQDLSPSQQDYLDSMPFCIRLPSHDLLLVHAGLVPNQPMRAQNIYTMYTIRELIPASPGSKLTNSQDSASGWVATKGGKAAAHPDSVPWASQWPGPECVVFGHDAARGLQRHRFALGLDTGCVYGGELTACILPSAIGYQNLKQQRNAEAGSKSIGRGQQVEDLDVLDRLGGKLVAVKARQVYQAKGGSNTPEAL